MAIFTDQLTDEVRLERMRPAQLDVAKARRPAIYVPLAQSSGMGTIIQLGWMPSRP